MFNKIDFIACFVTRTKMSFIKNKLSIAIILVLISFTLIQCERHDSNVGIDLG